MHAGELALRAALLGEEGRRVGPGRQREVRQFRFLGFMEMAERV